MEVERGKFLLAEDELVRKEDRLAKEKTELAIRRLKKEERKAAQAERNLRNQHRYRVISTLDNIHVLVETFSYNVIIFLIFLIN